VTAAISDDASAEFPCHLGDKSGKQPKFASCAEQKNGSNGGRGKPVEDGSENIAICYFGAGPLFCDRFETRRERRRKEPAMTVKAYLAQVLKQHGLGHLFGVPADFVIEFFKYLEGGEILEAVRMNDEPQAGFAADAYARIKGLGVVLVTYGAGGFKVVNSAAQAYVEGSPVLYISGAPSREEYLRGADLLHYRIHHVVKDADDQMRVFAQVTGMTERIDDVYTAQSRISRLIDFIIANQQPGYLEVPRNMWGAELPPRSGADSYRYVPPVTNERALACCVKEAAQIINASRRPVFWVDAEVQRHGLQESVRKLSERYRIPICTTLFGKSAIDENAPMHLGVYVGAQTASGKYDDDAMRRYVETADCVIMLGVSFSDFNFGIGTVQLAPDVRLINAGRNGVKIDFAGFSDVPIDRFVGALDTAGLVAHDFEPPAPAATFERPAPDTALDSDLFFSLLNERITGDTLVISDIGDCLFGAGRLNTSFTRFLAPAVYGSMGWSLAAALGAKMADRTLRPFVIVGDGALVMGQESVLAKLAELHLNPLIFVLSNQGYATLEGAAPGPYNHMPSYAFEKLADVYGGRGFSVRTVGELAGVLDQASQTSCEPWMINVILPPMGRTRVLRRVSDELSKGVGRMS
jgi:indolepyruvate decarboxylase